MPSKDTYHRVGSSEDDSEEQALSVSQQRGPNDSNTSSAAFTYAADAWTKIGPWIKIGAVLLLVGLLFWGMHALFANPDMVLAAVDYAKEHPWKTIPVYWFANVVCVVLLLPGGPFQIAAGAIWGIGLGSVASGSACLVANTAAFAIGRFAFRDSVSELITRKVPSFPAIEKAVVQEGMRLVLLLRLSPVLPDSLMNYALSLMPISLSVFVTATAVALVPYTLIYCYTGSISSDIIKTITGGGDDSGGGAEESGAAYALRITGIVVSVLFFVGMVTYIGAVLKKAIADAEAGSGGTRRGTPASRRGAVADMDEDEDESRGLLA